MILKFRSPCRKCLVQPACKVACKEFADYRRDYPLVTALAASGIIIGSNLLGQIIYWLITLYYPMNNVIKALFSILVVAASINLLLKYVKNYINVELDK